MGKEAGRYHLNNDKSSSNLPLTRNRWNYARDLFNISKERVTIWVLRLNRPSQWRCKALFALFWRYVVFFAVSVDFPPHNPDIANVFYRAGYIETWGQGIQKICDERRASKIWDTRNWYQSIFPGAQEWPHRSAKNSKPTGCRFRSRFGGKDYRVDFR